MAAACVFNFTCRRGRRDDGWIRTRRKGANREMLAMCSYHFCERSATALARQVSDFRVCDAAPLRQSGGATLHETQIWRSMHPPFHPLRRLQVSRRIRRDQESDGPQAGGHARGQAPIALGVLRDGRVRFIGADDKRHLTISTVVTMTDTFMAQLFVEGAMKRVLQVLPEHEKISCSFSESHWCSDAYARS